MKRVVRKEILLNLITLGAHYYHISRQGDNLYDIFGNFYI